MHPSADLATVAPGSIRSAWEYQGLQKICSQNVLDVNVFNEYDHFNYHSKWYTISLNTDKMVFANDLLHDHLDIPIMFCYSGQKCSAASRMFVPKSVWDELKARMLDIAKDVKQGSVSVVLLLLNTGLEVTKTNVVVTDTGS